MQIFDSLNNGTNYDAGEAYQEEDYEEEKQIEEQPEQLSDQSFDSGTSISEITQSTSVFVSIVQIYNENVNDLLRNNSSTSLKVGQDQSGRFYVKGLVEKEAKNPRDVFKLIKKANQNRASHGTNMNETSSRSHLILTVTVSVKDERDGSITCSKLNLVDLAGSERVKDSMVSGQQLKEAGYINKSLYTLAGVVDALQKGKDFKGQVNYRDSKLTLLLKDSLGGNCKTTLLAMVSPSQVFCNETNNTLSFAHSCSKVQNVIKPNKFKNSIPASITTKAKPEKKKFKFPWVELGKVDCEDVVIPSKKFGNINVLTAGDESWTNSVIFMHGCPSDSTAFKKQFAAYIYMNYRCYSIDFPGYGQSTGERQPSRSELIMNEKGPAEVVRSSTSQST